MFHASSLLKKYHRRGKVITARAGLEKNVYEGAMTAISTLKGEGTAKIGSYPVMYGVYDVWS